MGTWVCRKSDGAVMDWSADGSIHYDDRYHDHIMDAAVPNRPLPNYQCIGTTVTLRPVIPLTDTELARQFDSQKWLLALELWYLDRINELRILPVLGLTAITPAQARTGIVTKYKEITP